MTVRKQAVVPIDISCYLKLSHNFIVPWSPGTCSRPAAGEGCSVYVAACLSPGACPHRGKSIIFSPGILVLLGSTSH